MVNACYERRNLNHLITSGNGAGPVDQVQLALFQHHNDPMQERLNELLIIAYNTPQAMKINTVDRAFHIGATSQSGPF